MSHFTRPIALSGMYTAELLTLDHLAVWEGPFESIEIATDYARLIGQHDTNFIDFIIHPI